MLLTKAEGFQSNSKNLHLHTLWLFAPPPPPTPFYDLTILSLPPPCVSTAILHFPHFLFLPLPA